MSATYHIIVQQIQCYKVCYLITGLTADTIASTVRVVCGLGQLKQLMNTINAIYLLICANLIILLF